MVFSHLPVSSLSSLLKSLQFGEIFNGVGGKMHGVEAHFGKKKKVQWQEEAQQYKRGEERRISKVRKTIRLE